MSPWVKSHWVSLVVGGVLVVGGLVMSHRMAYNMGRAQTQTAVNEVKDQTAHVINNTMFASDSVHNLGVFVRVLRAAVKSPEAFPPEDLRYFRHMARSVAEEFDSRIVPAIKATEEKERQREPSRTLEDEERRIEFARKYAHEILDLDKRLGAR